MQIVDLQIPEEPSKINDPCLQKVIEWKRCLDLMEFVRVSKPEPPVDIQKTHVYGFLWCSTSCTNCIHLYSSS